ncbi:tripartite tricarboxylate transporter TctB family protein [Ideonella sp. A 288]|uniref:tripartite tricarboxylate transporter TctB family protein n=1 Tax=Ideonella sp. A 288 TaxID=1962181 RepID=UPI001F26702A|nr:tripartite tricarboxylate transporter TctB family protein [Ideonella sp. A 288]
MSEDQEPRRIVLTRLPEVLVALVLLLLAGLVIADSLRVGHGWAEDGPRAGYFPFFIGIGLALAAAGIVVQQVLAWREDDREFVGYTEAGMVWAVLWPMVLYALLIWPAGIYASSAALIVYFMRRHGRFGWGPSVLIAGGVTVLLFLVFERWFLVPLPKGPLEEWLGL